MKNDYSKHIFVTCFMIAALAAGIVFFISNHLDFILAATINGKFSLPNICYTIIRIITCIILPAIFIAPSMFPYSRVRLTKLCFWIQGILHLMTLSWIVFFFSAGYTFSDLFDREVVTFFQQNINNAFVSAQVFWDTYDLISILFTIILSGLYIALGITFDDNSKIVRNLCVALLAFKVITPILYNLIVNRIFFTAFWFTNNFIEFLSIAAFVAAICIASTDDEAWTRVIWDENHAQNKFEF